MKAHTTAPAESTSQTKIAPRTTESAGIAATFGSQHPEAITQRQRQNLIANSPQTQQQKARSALLSQSAVQMQSRAENHHLRGTAQRVEEEEPLQGQFINAGSIQLQTEQAPEANHTGLPNQLKAGIESLSGISLDHVKVHYNSTQPAQLNALAYAQGHDIHVGPGQEQHLPHEAWHVVQQAQGRVKPTMQMKEGVPVNDDAGLEHEADVMGAKALQVAPKTNPAPSAISTQSISTTSVAQTKGGNLETAVLPRFRSQPGQQLKVQTELEKAPAINRDGDGNNRLKVALENAISEWVIKNEEYFKPPVLKLSADIDEYLRIRETELAKGIDISLNTLTPDSSTYGRMIGSEAYPDQLKPLLKGKGTLHEHLLLQQMFIDKIYNTDVDKIIDEVAEKFNELFDPPLKKDELKPKKGGVDVGIGSMTYETGHDNAREEVAKKSSIPNVLKGGLGTYHKDINKQGPIVRGTDRFAAVESNAFIQSARLILDMPISGTGLSGSATDMFACAQLFGLTQKEDYALAAFSFFAQAGAHTFHEVMLMAKATGFNKYIPGNYISVIPAAHQDQLRSDLGTYRDLLEDPVAVTATEHAQDSKLHGWKDELELSGEIVSWAAKIQAFIANRFAVTGDKVTVTPITEGRSGDAVYNVIIERGEAGPFNGIFKVFHDADVADTEIQIGEKMREKSVSTPNNHGMARIETREDGVPSKAGVLFDLAKGESVHNLVKQVGPASLDPDTRPERLKKLEKAVVAVAKQLALLHGKNGSVNHGTGGRVSEPVALVEKETMPPDIKKMHEKGLYEAHLANCKRLTEEETLHIRAAFDELLMSNVVNQKLRKSMVHGDANAGNFIVDGDNASIIDVNTGVQSLGPTGLPKKTGAADTGRFLETLRTSAPDTLSTDELTQMDKAFHAAYLPGDKEVRNTLASELNQKSNKPKGVTNKENMALTRIEDEKLADEAAEQYYRACWVLNQLSHAEPPQLRNQLKTRLIELMSTLKKDELKLAGKLTMEVFQ